MSRNFWETQVNMSLQIRRIMASRALATILAVVTASGVVTTLADEKRINAFFRLQEREIIARLRASFPDLGAAPDARTVFLALRKLRNTW